MVVTVKITQIFPVTSGRIRMDILCMELFSVRRAKILKCCSRGNSIAFESLPGVVDVKHQAEIILQLLLCCRCSLISSIPMRQTTLTKTQLL